jgi:hypothetical protein
MGTVVLLFGAKRPSSVHWKTEHLESAGHRVLRIRH